MAGWGGQIDSRSTERSVDVVAWSLPTPGSQISDIKKVNRRPGSGNPWTTRLIAYGFLLPTFAFVIGFSYYPAFRALIGAFTNWDGFNPPTWVGLSNFVQAFQDPIFLGSLWHVAVWTAVGIPLALIPPFIAAEMIFHVKSLRAQYLYRTIFVLSFVLPTVVSILIWQYIFEPSGVLNALLHALGLTSLEHSWIGNPHLALGAVILMGFPWINAFNLLIYYAGLQSIPQEILDAAQMDGATGWDRIRSVDIPLVRSQTKLLLILSIIGVSQNLLVPLLMTSGGPGTSTTTPVFYMYQTAIQYDQYGYSMAIAFMLFAAVMVLAILNIRFFQSDAN